MVMIRVLFWLMAVGVVTSCQVEDTEPTSGTLNVDPNSDTVVPEGVTVADADLNSDGTIDITDLVIVSKFFGQDVPEGEVASASDGADPCQAISNLGIDALAIDPEIDAVEDNEQFKQTFDAPNGNVYVYALIAPTPHIEYLNYYNERIELAHTTYRERMEYYLPPCIAMRFTVDNKQMIKEFKAKSVGGNNKLSETMISPPLTSNAYVKSPTPSSGIVMHPNDTDPNILNTLDYYEDGGKKWGGAIERKFKRHDFHLYKLIPSQTTAYPGQLAWDKKTEDGFRPDSWEIETQVVFSLRNARTHDIEKWRKYNQRSYRRGIPIGNENVIKTILFPGKTKHYTYYYKWETNHRRSQESRFKEAGRRDIKDHVEGDFGAYLKMLPAEVQRRYFPEDIE